MRPIYNSDISRWAVQLLPVMLRKPIMVALLRVLITAVVRMQAELLRWMAERNYDLSHNSQVCKLRSLLNDKLDTEARRITIEDAPIEEHGVRVWRREEYRGLRLFPRANNSPTVVMSRSYAGAEGVDFVVKAPICIDQTRIASLINNNKLAGKRWQLILS